MVTPTDFLDRARYVAKLRDANVGAEAAEREADRRFGPAAVAIPAAESSALEKAVELACDRMMQQLGFEVIRFSHPGKTMQTEGIADRRYYRRPRPMTIGGPWSAQQRRNEACVIWFECKSATGRQRPGQKLFQELVEACGESYVMGGVEELAGWLVEHRVAERVGDDLRIVR